MSTEHTTRIDITGDMVAAGVDANLLNRGTDVDSDDLVVEIYRAMELARQGIDVSDQNHAEPNQDLHISL